LFSVVVAVALTVSTLIAGDC